MTDRQYRQRGYRDSGTRDKGKAPAPPAPRTPGTLPNQTVSRCADCGTLLPSLTDVRGQCPKCKAELHACLQCASFDPGRRFECAQPISERIPDKRARNNCTFFTLRVTVEKEKSSGSSNPEDARRALHNLFKK